MVAGAIAVKRSDGACHVLLLERCHARRDTPVDEFHQKGQST
jgi:hypothetical protein